MIIFIEFAIAVKVSLIVVFYLKDSKHPNMDEGENGQERIEELHFDHRDDLSPLVSDDVPHSRDLIKTHVVRIGQSGQKLDSILGSHDPASIQSLDVHRPRRLFRICEFRDEIII
jgi:hypothetical protein